MPAGQGQEGGPPLPLFLARAICTSWRVWASSCRSRRLKTVGGPSGSSGVLAITSGSPRRRWREPDKRMFNLLSSPLPRRSCDHQRHDGHRGGHFLRQTVIKTVANSRLIIPNSVINQARSRTLPSATRAPAIFWISPSAMIRTWSAQGASSPRKSSAIRSFWIRARTNRSREASRP